MMLVRRSDAERLEADASCQYFTAHHTLFAVQR
jgi:hypothetical protein